MKIMLERVVCLLVLFLLTPFVVNAADGEACTVDVKYELGVHASHVTYDVTFDLSTKTFNIELENVNKDLLIMYEDKEYKMTKKGIVLKGIKQGKNVNIYVMPQVYTTCDPDTMLRNILYTTPYYNEYLNSDECVNYPELSVCQTEFFGYELTYELFESMLTVQRNELYGEQQQEEPTEEGSRWKEILLDLAYKYGMQTLLFILGTGSVVILGQSALNRAKAKF